MAPFLTNWSARMGQGDEEFPASHCQVACVRAGTGAGNVTPANVELLVNFRNGPESPSEASGTASKNCCASTTSTTTTRVGGHGRTVPQPAGKLREAVVGAVEDVLGVTPN